jgi:hypothetical protein
MVKFLERLAVGREYLYPIHFLDAILEMFVELCLQAVIKVNTVGKRFTLIEKSVKPFLDDFVHGGTEDGVD